MSDPFIAQITLFAGNFAPRGWAFCDGQTIQISANSALFSLVGTTYGGNGTTTFALPDLRSRVAIHPGTGPGHQTYSLGQQGGNETTTLTTGQLPAHVHGFKQPCGASAVNEGDNPVNKTPGPAATDIYGDATPNSFMSPGVTDPTGNSQPVSILQPYLALNYIIALYGVYPSRN